MSRIIENTDKKTIIKLLENINLGIESMIHNYSNLYTNDEISLFKNIHKLISIQIKKLLNNNYTQKEIYEVLKYESYLKPYIFKCWEYEYKNGYMFISWFKNDKLNDIPKVISSTFSYDVNDTFCDSRYGINYEVAIDGFLGACSKDAATLIESPSKTSIYTIGETSDGNIINSYNLATPIITPIQTLDKNLNTYKSKHNEIILDSKYVKPLSVIYTNNNDLDMVNLISYKYNIPIEFKETSKKI